MEGRLYTAYHLVRNGKPDRGQSATPAFRGQGLFDLASSRVYKSLHSTQRVRFTDPSNDHRALHPVDDPNRKTNYVAAIIRMLSLLIRRISAGMVSSVLSDSNHFNANTHLQMQAENDGTISTTWGRQGTYLAVSATDSNTSAKLLITPDSDGESTPRPSRYAYTTRDRRIYFIIYLLSTVSMFHGRPCAATTFPV